MKLERSYYDSNNLRSVHAALAEYLKMQDAVTLFSTSKLERENEILRSQVVSVEDLRAEFDAKLRAFKRGYETQDMAETALRGERKNT